MAGKEAKGPQGSLTVPSMPQGSLSPSTRIHVDCRIRKSLLEAKLWFTSKLCYAMNQLCIKTSWDMGQALAQCIALIYLNDAKQADVVCPSIALW